MSESMQTERIRMPELNTHGLISDDETELGTEYETNIARLPPVDGGIAAWFFLAGCFVIETVLWGFPFSFGVLQNYYSTHEPFSRSPTGIAAVGTTCSGIMYLAAPLAFASFSRWPKFCRHSPFYGLALVAIALAASSFSTSVWHLILTQGVLYAMGGSLLYHPIFMYIDEWFVRRKGFAYGVMWAGSGTGGLLGPLTLEWGLEKYGHKTFLQGWSIALALLVAPFLYFVRPRLPHSAHAHLNRPSFRVGFGFVKTRIFWALQIGNIIQGLGYFIPTLYLPMFANSIGISNKTASLMLGVVNAASVPGIVILSSLSDRTNVTNIVLISTVGSALSIFLLWGFSTSIAVLVLFTITYGFFAGGYTATYAGIMRELRNSAPGADLGSIIGLICAGRGIGNVICGPVSESILRGGALGDKVKFAYGTEYGTLILFTGVTAVLATIPWVSRRMHFI